MKKSLALLLVVALMAMGAILVACGEEETTTTAASGGGTDTTAAAGPAMSVLENPQGLPADPSLTPELGGTVKWILGMNLSNFGAPWSHMPGPNEYVARACCEPLATMDSTGARTPCLATEWVTDVDAMTYTFTLRENVKFHDGTDFDAAAVVWNLEKSKSEGDGTMANAVSVEATDDYTVVVTLSEWDPLFLESLGSCLMMVSPTAAEELGDELATHPVGTGPFMFDDFVPEVSIDLVANPDYWQEGLPYLDGIHVEMVLDKTVAFAAFLNGECDYLEGPTGAQKAEAEAEGFGTLFMVSGIMGLTFDATTADSPFTDLAVRQAIAMAADYDEIIDTAFDSMYFPTHQFAATLAGASGQGYDADIAGYSYDQATALQMLTDAGYGLDNPINCNLTYQTNAENDDMMTAIQAALADVGVNITLVGLDNVGWADYITTQAPGELCAFQSSYQVFMPYKKTLTQALRNGSGWHPLQSYTAEYDALYDAMMAETDASLLNDYYKQLNKMLVDNCVALPNYLRTNYKLVGKNLHDMGAGQLTGEFDPAIVWLEQ